MVMKRMRVLKCQVCSGEWIIDEINLKRQRVCPYCASSIVEKTCVNDCYSLDQAIYAAILSKGINIVDKPQQLAGLMMDIAPKIKKEIHIFKKTISDNYGRLISDFFEQSIEDSEVSLFRIRQALIEEEGLAEKWADYICESIYEARRLYIEEGDYHFVNVDIKEYSLVIEECSTRKICLDENHHKEMNEKNTEDNYYFSTIVYSPMKGMVIPLEDVPDEPFASGFLGQGIAIVPTEGKLYAPFDGVVIGVFDTKHAFSLMNDDNVEMLIHIGLDTVSLGGKYFTPKVLDGQKIKKGELLAEFDIDDIKKKYELYTPILTTNSDEFHYIKYNKLSGMVKVGEPIYTLYSEKDSTLKNKSSEVAEDSSKNIIGSIGAVIQSIMNRKS